MARVVGVTLVNVEDGMEVVFVLHRYLGALHKSIGESRSRSPEMVVESVELMLLVGWNHVVLVSRARGGR